MRAGAEMAHLVFLFYIFFFLSNWDGAPPGCWCPTQTAYSAYRERRYWVKDTHAPGCPPDLKENLIHQTSNPLPLLHGPVLTLTVGAFGGGRDHHGHSDQSMQSHTQQTAMNCVY